MKQSIWLFSILLTTSAAIAANTPSFSDAVKVGNTLYLSGKVGSPKLVEPPVS